MIKSIKIVIFIVGCLFQTLVCAEWNDITHQVSFNKSSQAFDRINRALFSLVTIHNTSGTDLAGPLRLRVFDPSIPFTEPSTTNSNESFLEIPDGLVVNESKIFRVDFELLKHPLTYSLALECDSRTLHVTTTGSDEEGDGTEASPFATIQHAINQSNDYGIVIVHDGRYVENINFMGKEITVGSLFVLDGNEDHIVDTIIDGNRSDSTVIFDHNEGPNTQLVGLSITGGYAIGGTYDTGNGGGVRAIDSTPRLEFLRIFENEALREGGGIYFDDGRNWPNNNIVISNNIIAHNRSGWSGGGIRFGSNSVLHPIIENSAIIGNYSSASGGGLFFYHVGILENSIVAGNEASVGAGIYCDWGTITGQQTIHITNTTIISNSAREYGGGISYVIQGGDYTNSIVWNNYPDNLRRKPEWWDDGITFDFSLISPLQPGTGNFDADPLFIANPNPGPDAIWGTTDDDYGDLRLQAASPVIDQGDSTAITLTTDYQGADRIYGSAVDIGAYEWHPQ